MGHPLDDSTAANELRKIVIRHVVERSVDFAPDYTITDNDLGLSIGVDVHDGRVSYVAHKLLPDGRMQIVDFGSFVAPPLTGD